MKKLSVFSVMSMLAFFSACSDSDSSKKDPVGPGDTVPSESSSSESEGLSSSSSFPDAVRFDATGLTGEFTDSRDGHVYKIVKIGDQIWMAENLHRDADDPFEKYWYDEVYDAEVTECSYSNYGFVDYNIWGICGIPEPIKGICPDGWHLPTTDEWRTVIGLGIEPLNVVSGDSVELYWSTSISDDSFESMPTDYVSVKSNSDVQVLTTGDVENFIAHVRCVYGQGNTEWVFGDNESDDNEPESPEIIEIPAYAGPYGELKDDRDGNVYRTVKIADQTWMADNLKFETADGMSLCNCSDTTSCDSRGRLYPWKSAQTACPAGWHLPSQEEVGKLTAYADQVKRDMGFGLAISDLLKDTTGWRHLPGYNVLGFSALPAGFAYLSLEGKPMDEDYCGREFDFSVGTDPIDFASYWTSTELEDGTHAFLNIKEDRNGKSDLFGLTDYTGYEEDEFNHLLGMAIRCLKD